MTLMDRLSRVSPKLFAHLYHLDHWFFQWTLDNDGDITLSVATVVHFTKYKEHTVVRFGRQDYRPAPKWVRPVGVFDPRGAQDRRSYRYNDHN